ncbi:Peptidylprolyl isomerase [Aphelenchoides bicaudatus]|nr:Peptidylprolyl isomerase [Aphelenchoides bicaudatus]
MSSPGETIDLTSDGGVLKTIIKPATSDKQPAAGDTVFVHYTGVLAENGEKFDSSRDRGDPFSFSLGKSQVIKGWDIGVATMKIGEVCELLCRADYAYGSSGSPPKIPGNAQLKFEVELLRFEGEDISPERDNTITKSIIEEGEKYNCPSENAPVTVHAVGSFEGRVFYDKQVEFVLGEGSEVGLPEGVDRAIRRVNKGEKCRVVLKGKFGYGLHPPAEFNLPPNAEVEFTLFLPDFKKVKASWEMTEEEKLTAANELKNRGTKFLTDGKLSLALNKYNSIGVLLEHTKPIDNELQAQIDAVLMAGWLNCALVNMKQGETAECIKHCDKVLEKQPNHVKALYRKAQALQQRKEFEDAIDIYKKVIEIEPDNKAASQQILTCKHQVAELLALEKKRFAGMFDRLSKNDDHADEPSVSGEQKKSVEAN